MTASAALMFPESRKDLVMVFASGMLLMPACVFLRWFFKKFPTPGVQFLLAFGVLAAFFLFIGLCEYLGLQRLRVLFSVGMVAIILFIPTLAIMWLMKLLKESTDNAPDLPLNAEQKALRDSVVGEYEHKYNDEEIHKDVFLENGVFQRYINGEKALATGLKWTIKNGEIVQYDEAGSGILVYKINKDKSITRIAYIDDGKRKEDSKEHQTTAKKNQITSPTSLTQSSQVNHQSR